MRLNADFFKVNWTFFEVTGEFLSGEPQLALIGRLFFQILWRICAKLRYMKGKSIGKVEKNKITIPHTPQTDI